MTAFTNDPVTANQERLLVRQTATGFEQGIAAFAGLVTAGPLGALASWATIRGVQGKWTPWFVLGVPAAPILGVAQLAVAGAVVTAVTPEVTETPSSPLTEAVQGVDFSQMQPAAPTVPSAPVKPQVPTVPTLDPKGSAPVKGNQFCYFPSDGVETEFRCQVDRRINANGHVVWDIISYNEDGSTMKTTVVLWTDGTAEVFQGGDRYEGTQFTDDKGYVEVQLNNGYIFAF